MIRLALVLGLAITAGCKNEPPAGLDAAVLIDAAIDAAAPDAFVCAAPNLMCGAACLDVTADETNCGDCGVMCGGGEICATTCTCPEPFIGAALTPSGFDQFQGAGSITIAIAPNISTGINPFLVGYTATTPLATDIDLATIPLGSAPFVAAAYGFDLDTMETEANYAATAGTLRITKACATELEGTLTGATFRGVTGGLTNPQLDPEGCQFTVPSVTFHIMTTACP